MMRKEQKMETYGAITETCTQKAQMEAIRQEVQKLCGADCKVEIQEIVRNNGIVKLGMAIGEPEKSASPLIYLEPYLRSLNEGNTIEETAKAIYEVHQKCCGQEPDAANEFFQVESVKDRIIYQLVNLKKNQEMLGNMPHRIIGEDLAAVFAVLWKKDDTGIMTTKIKREHVHCWQMDEDELWELANKNTPKLFLVVVKSLEDVFMDLMKTQLEESGIALNAESWDRLLDAHRIQTEQKDSIQPKLYVLTNVYTTWGASAILYPEVLKNLSRKLGGDLLILPSSVHEVIFMRKENTPEYHVLAGMVKEINKKEVLPEEVLSDSVYIYTAEENVIHQIHQCA